MDHNFGHRGKTHYYEGKAREEYHPYDRKSGTGRGHELKKEGYGKGNWGNDKFVYKKKGETVEEENKAEADFVQEGVEGEAQVEGVEAGEYRPREYREKK